MTFMKLILVWFGYYMDILMLCAVNMIMLI